MSLYHDLFEDPVRINRYNPQSLDRYCDRSKYWCISNLVALTKLICRSHCDELIRFWDAENLGNHILSMCNKNSITHGEMI